MDRRQLLKLIREWLRRLNLRGWTVTLRLVRHAELADGRPAGSYYADITPDPQHQCATMRICRRGDLAAAGLCHHLAEETIVHELLHLRLDPMSALSRDSGFEVGLDALAEELVRLARIERGRRK